MPTHHLAVDWLALCRRVEARGDVAAVGASLLGRWAQPHRAYHDLGHLDEVLARVEVLAAAAADADLVRLAAWFHDAVYDPTATDNEARSAQVASTVLRGLDVEPAAVTEVARLVRLTATHEAEPADHNAAVLCDADLGVLAAGGGRYPAYVEGVRREYAHLDDVTFAAGRAQVLARLLARPALFATTHGQQHWEQPARANVTAELARLRTAGG